MIIKKLSINGYGRFKNEVINLKNGFNLIYGKNEAGKSTLQAFIKNMLFSFETKSADSEGRLPDIKKYKPWEGDAYGGAIEVCLDNGQFYKVERDFKNKECRVYNLQLEEVTTSFNFNKREGLQFGETIFNMDRDTFLTTALVRQAGTKILKNDKQEIFSRIINLQESGEENLSVTGALAALNKAKVDIGHKNTKNKSYNRVTERILFLTEKKKKATEEREKVIKDQCMQEELADDIRLLGQEISILERKAIEQKKYRQLADQYNEKTRLEKKLRDIEHYDELIKEINDKLYDYDIRKNNNKKIEKLTENDIVDKLKEMALLKSEKENKSLSDLTKEEKMLQQKRKTGNLLFTLGVVMVIIFSLLSVFLTKAFFIGVALFITLTAVSLWYRPKKEWVDQIKSMIIRLEDLEERKKQILDFIYQAGETSQKDLVCMENKLNEIFAEKNSMNQIENLIKIEVNRKNDYEKIKCSLLNEMGYEEVEQWIKHIKKLEIELKKNEFTLNKEADTTNYEKILEETKVEKNNKQQKIAGIRAVIERYWMEDEEMAELTEEIARNQENLEEIKKTQKAIQYAYDLIELSAKEMRMTIIPKMNVMMGETLKKITGDFHCNLMTGKDAELNTEHHHHVRSIFEFSDGTIDQMYLSLRIAATELFSKNEKLPMMLDEIFAFYDKERMNNSFRLLHELSKTRQIILFTCKEDEVALSKTADNINIIGI